ncbi:MAG: 1-acyl-sn-glycerol-3-phosphate acyltransferase [Chloroflexi bacterium]|nr:1-acyl-sn-glycerol-3-phosphate acyltransferase [Chloroflexota bacterium]
MQTKRLPSIATLSLIDWLGYSALPDPRVVLSHQTVDTLTHISVNDMLESLGLQGLRRGRRLASWLCLPAARRFAYQVATYDHYVGEKGLQAGAAWFLRHFIRALEVSGQEHLPPSGPLLIVANHPGLSDTLALFASLPRPDLHIVAADRPFLRALPHTERHLIFVREEEAARLGVVRTIAARLRQGQAILTFPAGEIEPDPAVLPGAVAALPRWSQSIGLFARLVPALQIVPAIVSGVLSPAAHNHPLTRLRSAQKDRERLGATLQIAIPAFQAVTVRVALGPPLLAADLLAAGHSAGAITQAVIDQAQRLIEQPPSTWRKLV